MHYSPEPLHIPDGFLSVPVSIFLWLVSALVVYYALRQVNREMGERQVPLMGVLAAAIFAGQMLNFAVGGGTSGHLMGAALAAILLGPWAAILVLTTVVGVQALIFQDGGLLVLGANIFNMAVVGVTVALMAYQTALKLSGGRKWGVLAGAFGAAWLSTEIASLAVALQLAISGTSPANIAVPAMAAVHAVIGVGEGLITLGAVAFVSVARPDLLQAGGAPQEGRSAARGGRIMWVIGLLLALGLAIASPLASSHPDGLEWVAEQEGFLDTARGSLYQLIPDYLLPGISNQALATILAGVIGVLIVFCVAVGVAYLRRNRQAVENR
jgi:cobalt/nickel transport system permease protein